MFSIHPEKNACAFTFQNYFRYFFFFLLSIIILPVNAETNSKLENNVLRDTLSNGLRVIIVKNSLAPVVTTEINYLAGATEVPEGFPGTAHATEHMMFRGSKGLSANQLNDISAALGGDYNADTQHDVTQYFFTIPAEDLDIAMHIEALRMKSLLCTDSSWKNERGAIEQEVANDLSNPVYVFYTKLMKALFSGTPYANTGLGTRPSFNKTTASMLKKFHDTWYAPNNAVFIIVGDIDPRETLNKVKTLFGNIPRKKLPEKPELNLQPVKSDTLNLTTDTPYGYTLTSFRMPGTKDPDYPAAQILADVLSSQRADLYGLVPQGKALYSSFELDGMPRAGMSFAYGIFPRGGDAHKLMKETNDIIANYVKNGLPPDLVLAAKNHEIADAEFQKNSISGLANVWSDAVANNGKESPDAELEMLKKVTVQDVNRVAKIYLDLNHAIFAILTPEPSGKPITRSSFGGAESFAPKNPMEVELPDWASTAMARLKVPKSVVNPIVDTLSNGIKLIIQPESISNTVSVYGEVKNNSDLETPEGKYGVDNVLSQLFSYGTTTYNRLAFQKELDDIGANENAGTGFSLQVLTDHFERGVQLLADNLLHPALPEQAFKVVQMQTAKEVAGELESPDYLKNKALWDALLPKGDPQLRHSTPGSVDSLSMQDIKDYYSKVFRPDLTAIVVAGKVNPDTAKNVIEKYFAAWNSQGEKPRTEYSSVPDNKPATTNVPDKSRVQDEVTLAQILQLTRDNPDYYVLQLSNQILTREVFAARLYKDLRVNTGLVYYVHSSFNIGKTRSSFQVMYGCDPPNVFKAKSVIVRDLKDIQNSPVTDKELRRAQSAELRDVQLSESSVSSIGSGLLSRAIHQLPLNEPTIAAEHYLEVKPMDIQDAFKKWIRPDDFVLVSQGPNPK
ncbi:MAG: pitrilysin family protein [Ignavibacteriaceae bacterium]